MGGIKMISENLLIRTDMGNYVRITLNYEKIAVSLNQASIDYILNDLERYCHKGYQRVEKVGDELRLHKWR